MPQKLTGLQINEVSLVDRPANSEEDPVTGAKIPRARIALFKRDDSSDNEDITKYSHNQDRDAGKFKAGGGVGKDQHSAENAGSPEAHEAAARHHLSIAMTLVDTNPNASRVHELAARAHEKAKADYSKANSRAARNLSQVAGHLSKKLSKSELDTDARAAEKACRKANPDKGDDELPDVLDTGDQSMALTMDEIDKRQQELDARLNGLAAENTVLKEENSALKVEMDSVIKMSKKERKAFSGMSAEKRKEYLAADADKRKSMLEACDKAKGDDEECDEPDEDDMEKQKKVAKVMEDLAATNEQLAKAAERISKAEAELEAVRKRERLANFTKRAEEELPHTSGAPVAKGQMLMDLADKFGEDSDTFKMFLGSLKTADKSIASNYGEVGKSGGGTIPVEKVLEAKVEEIAKRDRIDTAHAWEKALVENPDLYYDYERQHRALVHQS